MSDQGILLGSAEVDDIGPAAVRGDIRDFIEIDDDPEVFLRDLLKPAKVQSIEIKDKKATIKVEEDQKPIAI